MNNFDLERQLREESEEDWIFGALSQPGIVSIPEAERDQYLPKGETQFSTKTDFYDCATRSPVNHFEALFTYHYQHKMLPENKKWLEGNGYLQDGKVTLSDRFISILAGTTRQGNSLKTPLETIRKQGLIPKVLLPKGDDMTFDVYYDPNLITQKMRDIGQEFIRRFPLNYEKVYKDHIADALKDDMIGVAGYGWPKPVNGVFSRTEGDFNHAFLLYRLPKFQAYDNYYDYTATGVQITDDFTKNLAPDYKFYDWGYRAYISNETSLADRAIPLTMFETLSKFGLLAFFADWWQRFNKQ